MSGSGNEDLIRKIAVIIASSLAFVGQAVAENSDCSGHVAARSAQGSLEGETLKADTNQRTQITSRSPSI